MCRDHTRVILFWCSLNAESSLHATNFDITRLVSAFGKAADFANGEGLNNIQPFSIKMDA